MKHFLILGILVFSTNIAGNFAQETLQCGIKTCFMELLNFGDMSFGALMKKGHTAVFCIKECSPPPVYELFQSLSYYLTNSIPGYCTGEACIDNNRFVALSHCLHNRSWPLVQCATKLVHLAQLALEPVRAEDHRNKTCGIVIGAINCVEKSIEQCGPKPYSLVDEIFGQVFQKVVNYFCRVQYQKDGHMIPITAPSTLSTVSTTPRVPSLLPPVAKGYISRPRSNSATKSQLSLLTSLMTVPAILVTLWYR